MAIRAQSLRDFLEAKKTLETTSADIGPTLRALRIQNGLTQTFVASSAGVKQGYVSQVESGKKIPSADSLERIMRAVSEGSTSGNDEDQEEDQG